MTGVPDQSSLGSASSDGNQIPKTTGEGASPEHTDSIDPAFQHVETSTMADPKGASLRDEMAVQIKHSNLSLTSFASLQLYLFFFIAYCNSWGTGFDSSLISAMNSNNGWHAYFGVPKAGGILGIVTAIYTVGNICGSFVAGPAADRYGRKWGMFAGASVVVFGGIILCTAKNIHAFMAGRFFTGFGVAIARSAAPAYVAEISPPQWRGPVVALYNSLWTVGAIISSAISHATGPLHSDLSWRLPLIMQVVPSSIVIMGCLFMPESPRWLIANDRYDEAQKLVEKYHAAGATNSSLVSLQMAEMRESIQLEASDKRWYDYSELWSSPSNRYRTFLNIAMAFMGQWDGNNLTSYYLANNLRAIGITDQNTLLLYNMANYLCAFGGAMIGSFSSYFVNRRTILIGGFIAMSLTLTGLAVCASEYHPAQAPSVSHVFIFFIFFVGVVHAGAINPLVVAYPVEVLHTNSRSKGMGLNNFGVNVAEFVNTYATPIAFQNIAWRIYLIYIVWNILQSAIVYLTFVETRGRTLEEMDAIFEAKSPVKASTEKPRIGEICQ